MLLGSEKGRLVSIKDELSALSDKGMGRYCPKDNRRYFDSLRGALRLYEEVVCRCHREGVSLRGEAYLQLRELAARALDELGGQGEPSCVSLKQYDHVRYGPFLGVSDEGSAAPAIRSAALASPKMSVVSSTAPIVVGVAHDAERLAAVGEVAVGPSEYREIRLECMGRILTSTNVGTRLNLRYYKRRPVIEIGHGRSSSLVRRAVSQAEDILEPFWRTPDNVPRPITVFVRFATRMLPERRLEILNMIADAFRKGDFCNPEYHRLGVIVSVKRGSRGLRAAKGAIDLARDANLAEVAIDGAFLKVAEDKISMPGLLNYFNVAQTAELLRYAATRGIPISPRNRVDPDTVARNVWSGLLVARNMGLELGKYGLFPLTFEELDEVIGMVQGWFSSWTAAPAFYIDFPAVDSTNVYTKRTIVEGLKRWLELVSKHKTSVVLIDTADKDKGRRLLKNSPSDKVGILKIDQVAEIDAFAARLGVKVLWAGGITMPQSFEMSKLGVFGVYVTSAAAVAKPVTYRYRRDPMLASEKEPTFHGVSRTKLLLEAGFLVGRLKEYGFYEDADVIEQKAKQLIQTLRGNYPREKVESEQDELVSLTMKAWQQHLSYHSPVKNSSSERGS